MTKYNLDLVAGARPNFMKIAPIVRALGNSTRFDYRLVHTGQHYDREMSDVFFEELGIPEPDHYLDVGSNTHAHQTAQIMEKYENICLENRPDLTIVVGDVNSTLACSVVAKKLGIAVAHVEAGLRSGDMTMPEEINRIVTDSIADLFFVTEKSGVDCLIKEGKRDDQIHFVGHVMIDNLLYQLNKLNDTNARSFESTKITENLSAYGVITLHRPSNVDTEENLNNLIDALEQISLKLPLVFPAHPRTRSNLEKFNISLPDTIILTKPLPYMDFLNLWKDARLVLTDSGGMQEETTALGVPCITMRENTERPITIEEGTNILAGTSSDKIVKEALKVLNGERKAWRCPELWDGNAAYRIVKILEKQLL